MMTMTQHPNPVRNRWLARAAGLLSAVAAAIPLGVLLLFVLGWMSLAGGGTLGGFGAAAQPADAAWVPMVSAAVVAVGVGVDILIGVAVARAVRHRS
jgi:hypothetical protein